MTVRVTLKNAPIETFKIELNLPECHVVPCRVGSMFQKVKANDGKCTVLVDDFENGSLIMYTFNRDTFFQIIPPSCVVRNSDKQITAILLNDDVPRVQCDGRRMEFDKGDEERVDFLR